jgi:hypothetical protein
MIETIRPCPSPSPRRPDTVGERLLEIQRALRAENLPAVSRGMLRLDGALRSWHAWIHGRGFRGDDLAEAHQRILLRLYAVAQRHQATDIRSADGFARQAADWVLRDLASERRAAAEHDDIHDSNVLRRVEASGVPSRDDITRLMEGERALRDARRAFRAFFRSYLERAAGDLPRRQLIAWFFVRVRRRSADQTARVLGVTGLAQGGRPAVWQWAKRGCDRVLRLADADPDTERARVMREAAVGSAPIRATCG